MILRFCCTIFIVDEKYLKNCFSSEMIASVMTNTLCGCFDTDINERAVTFETANSSQIVIKTLNLDVFSHDILLSFRTHAPSGILLYAHDNMHNFIQLHLEGGNQIDFTFNNADRIQRLSVVSDGSFNDGKWHQIHVDRESNSTTLAVDYRYSDTVQLPDGWSPLTVYSGTPFGQRSGETIIPARPGYAIMPFKNMYIGGIVTQQIRSELPGFYGCLRGLKIGDQLFHFLNEPDSDIAPGQ